MAEERVGLITHYFGHIQVAAVKLEAELKVGDIIRVKGHTSDFTQSVDAMQLDHQEIPTGAPGQEVAIRVKDHARQHDVVYKVTA